MTGSKILERYTGRIGGNATNAASAVPASDEGDIDDLGCFGWLRGIRDRALSLELRLANGNIIAVPYHTIERFEFDPSEGILLAVAGSKIRLRGRHLNAEMAPTIRLFEGLTRHRVPYVREARNGDSSSAAEHATVVDSIEW